MIQYLDLQRVSRKVNWEKRKIRQISYIFFQNKKPNWFKKKKTQMETDILLK